MRAAAVLFILLLLACGKKTATTPAPEKQEAPVSSAAGSATSPPVPGDGKNTRSKYASFAGRPYIEVVAHHMMFRQGSIQLKVAFLRGRMYATNPKVIPSFDQPDSFVIDVEDGLVAADMGTVSNLLNSDVLKGSHLDHVKLSAHGDQLQMNATLHKGVPLPIQAIGDLGASADGRVKIHLAKISVLKIPVKAMLDKLNVTAADMFDAKGTKGVEVDGDDVLIDTDEILPAPHNIGKVDGAHISKQGELVQVYGSGKPDATQVKQWRNFMRLRGGTINFGKITMHDTDLILIDLSQDEWFDFDLARYQEQLVNGYERITPTAGLQVFMPDISKIPATQANKSISLQWIKNRAETPPVAEIAK